MNRHRGFLFGVVLTFLSGCTLAPKYTRPEAPIPSEWPTGPAYEETRLAPVVDTAPETGWRDFFADERLQKIIEMALRNNRDLRTAALNVERARGMYGIQKAELFPVINATAVAVQQRVTAEQSGVGESLTIEQYGVNLGISAWEIDFFGRIRSLKDAALQTYFATEQGRRSAQILLVAEVADAYLLLAANRENLKLSQSTLDAQQASYDLIRRRYENGISNELELRQVQTRVDAAKVDVALYTRLTAQGENALNLLAGAPVPNELKPTDLSGIALPRPISAGLPSDTLLRRPDILQAENMLKAANANIGAARAAFFPRISLTTAIGTSSNELTKLFTAGTDAWNYAPQIVLPIFDARTWSALKVSKVDTQLAVTNYEKSIQTAFREVADALATRGTVDEQLAAQESLVKASGETYRLAGVRYSKGIDSFLGVLDAQRSLYAAQQGLIAIRLAKLANQVRLYAVLGGGAD